MNFLPLFLIFSFPLVLQADLNGHVAHSDDAAQQSVIDFDVERDLELFHSMNQSNKGVLAQFDHTFTTFGKQRLYKQFKNPLTDVDQIKTIQDSLRFLIANPTELGALQLELGTFGMSESAGFGQQGHGAEEIIKKFYFEFGFMQGLNDDALALDLLYGTKILGLFAPVVEHLIFHYALEYLRGGHEHKDHKHCDQDHGHKKHKHKHGKKDKHKHDHGHDHDHHCLIHSLQPADGASALKNALFTCVNWGHLALHLWSMKEMATDLSAQKAVLNLLYKNIGALSTCVKSMHRAHQIIQSHPELQAALGTSSELAQFFAPSDDQDFNDVCQELLGDYFDHDEDLSIFSRVGVTLRTYTLLQKYLPRFQKAFSEFGYIDSLCSIARHISMHDGMANSFCFVDFIQDATMPCIDFNKFWNVALGAESVANDLSLGKNAGLDKIILTGPNKAGKSSVMKALALNIILAQTYGIAAAQSARMTIFHKILSYMIVTDDIGADQSKFVAGLMKADKCLRSHKKLQPGQFAFVVLDDALLDGTTFEKRQQASYQFVKELGALDNNLVLVATHLPLLTMLEQETQGLFRNYRMKIDLNAEGKKESSFSLEPGVCAQEDVFDIIDAQGYNVSFIEAL